MYVLVSMYFHTVVSQNEMPPTAVTKKEKITHLFAVGSAFVFLLSSLFFFLYIMSGLGFYLEIFDSQGQ